MFYCISKKGVPQGSILAPLLFPSYKTKRPPKLSHNFS